MQNLEAKTYSIKGIVHGMTSMVNFKTTITGVYKKYICTKMNECNSTKKHLL